MINIKLVYLTNEPEFLSWKEFDESGVMHINKIKCNPIKEIYIDGTQYKRQQIQEVFKEEFIELCRKMDTYLRKKESIFSSSEFDVVKAFNTYPYKNYKLVSYEVVDKLVAIELQVS